MVWSAVPALAIVLASAAATVWLPVRDVSGAVPIGNVCLDTFFSKERLEIRYVCAMKNGFFCTIQPFLLGSWLLPPVAGTIGHGQLPTREH